MKKKIYQRAISLVLVFMLCVTYLSVQEVQAAEVTELSSDTTYTDMLEDASAEKCYSYTMDKTGYFKVQFAVAGGTPVADGWKLELIDVITGTTVYSTVIKETTYSSNYNFPKGRRISIKILAAGDNVPVGQQYKITINSYEEEDGEQEKLISESEFWSVRSKNATTIKLGEDYWGDLCMDQDDDLYKFAVSKNGYVTIWFSPNSDDVGCGYTVKLLSSKGKEIAKYNAKTSGKKKYYLAKGTYYVDVQQRAGYSNPPLNKTYTISAEYKASVPAKVKFIAKRNMLVSWNTVSGADGYQVSYSTSSSFKNAKTKTTSKTSYTPTNLTKGKTYYVRVRAYRKDASGKKIYGSWSKSISLKWTSVTSKGHWYNGYQMYKWYDMGNYYFVITKNISEGDEFHNRMSGNIRSTLEERYPDKLVTSAGCHVDGGFVYYWTAVDMDSSTGFPIWPKYIWD